VDAHKIMWENLIISNDYFKTNLKDENPEFEQ
jgi:hypothetical protein